MDDNGVKMDPKEGADIKGFLLRTAAFASNANESVTGWLAERGSKDPDGEWARLLDIRMIEAYGILPPGSDARASVNELLLRLRAGEVQDLASDLRDLASGIY